MAKNDRKIKKQAYYYGIGFIGQGSSYIFMSTYFVLFLTNSHEHTATPQFEPELRRNFSYPSGHTLLGWCSALLLSEINPERADTILKRGMMYGESRVIVGAHWQSDVDAGRLAAAAAYARMHSSERFLEQMRLARQEFRCKAGLATLVEMKAYRKEAQKRAKAKKDAAAK